MSPKIIIIYIMINKTYINLIYHTQPTNQYYSRKKRLSNKFWAVSFYSFNRQKNKLKNKAFMLKFSVKAFVMS